MRLKRPSVRRCFRETTFYSPYQTTAMEWMRQQKHTSSNPSSRRRRWGREQGSGSQRSTASLNKAAGSFGLTAKKAEEPPSRSEEHTSELQSLRHLVCRLLLEKKNI